MQKSSAFSVGRLILVAMFVVVVGGSVQAADNSTIANNSTIAKDAAGTTADVVKQPNIVFILADDLGWSDTTLFGTTNLYETPNVQRLARRGVTFTHAYSSSPLCSPTRCSILTGLSPARTGMTSPAAHLPKEILQATPGTKAGPTKKTVPVNSVTRIDPKYYTISERLQDEGYATGHFGKWHLGRTPFSPLENGFDVDVPHWPGPGPAGSFVAPWKFPDFDPDTPNEHIEDRMAKEATAFMRSNLDRPFFLNYWMFSVHAPFDAKADLIEKYRQKVAAGDPQSPQRCPTYAAMIHSMDDAIGTLLDEIDRLGIADNTIIIFASDNGGNMYNWVDDTVPTSNAPLRGGKASMYEGGVRGPCAIIWPGKTNAGSSTNQPIQSCDFYPTVLEMLAIEPRQGQAFDGISIVPTLRGQQQQRDEIFTYFPHSPNIPDWLPPAVSVVKGDWKLIRLFHHGQSGRHRWKLFNLAQDVGETNDLTDQYPEKVAQLDALIQIHLDQTGAVTPTINPNFDPSKYDLADEGKAEPHGKNKRAKRASRSPRSSKTNPTPKTVANWRSNRDCDLRSDANGLIVDCVGGDPFLTTQLDSAIPRGDYKVKIVMASRGSSAGSVFWRGPNMKSNFNADARADFEINNDEDFHTYMVEVKLETDVVGLRIDPSTGVGTVTIKTIELLSPIGVRVGNWKFDAGKP